MTAETRRLEMALQALLEHYPDPTLRTWVLSTARAFQSRLRHIVDPAERDQAQRAALVLIRETLREWSRKPPVRH